MKTTMFALGIIFLIVLITVIICVLLCMPLATIWALNTLFGFKIAFTVWNWVACWILILTINGLNISAAFKRR